MDKEEEILDRYAIGCTSGQYDIEVDKAHAAMREYAKLESIGFAEWIIKNSYQGVDTSDEGIIWNIAGSATCLTSTELYSLYKDQMK